MIYNLTENSNVYVNTTVGNVDLTVAQIVDLTAYSESAIKTLSSGTNDILCVDTDFGARINTGEVRYYFSSDSVSGTVSSGIEFFYKNESFEDYTLLDTNIGFGYYYTTVTGTSAPRYIRLIHTVSGTAVSGTLHGFHVMNDDTIVDFGSDGSLTSEATSTSVYGGQDEIEAVAIYNSGNNIATAYVTLEPQGTSIDDLLTISTSSNGPWIGIKEDSQILADYENGWGDGNLSDELEESDDRIVLKSMEQSGTYTTKIFDNADSVKSFIYVEIESEPDNSFVTKDDDREVRTIEIRSTSQRPKDYAIVRCFYSIDVGGTERYLYYKDRFRDNGALEYTSGYLGNSSNITSHSWNVRCATTDGTTGKTAGFVYRDADGSDRAQLRVFAISKTGSYSNYTILQHASIDAISSNCYHVCWDSQGGTWWSLYSNYSRSGYTINQGAGYYLIRFASGFSPVTCKQYTSYKQPWDMDCVYDSGKLWYTDRNYNQIKLIDTNGTVEAYYSGLTGLYGICANSDGGCWFISGTDLIRLDENANYVTAIEDIGSSSLRNVITDGDDALYIRDGNYVKRIFLDGTVDFSKYVGSAERLLRPATDTGVWVRCSDNRIKFVHRVEQAIKANFSYSYYPAVMEYSYDSSGYGFHFPINLDTHWQNLEWQEARPSKFSLPVGDEYYQARITLQANKPVDFYDVPSTEEWTPEDDFTQTNNEAPRAHRWVPSDDTNSIYITNNKLRFKGGAGGSKNIHSNNLWYIETDASSEIDIQFYYNITGTWNPPTSWQGVYMRLYSLEEGHSGHYIEGFSYRETDSDHRLRIRIYDGSNHDGAGSATITNSWGYLRLYRNISEGRWYVYDYMDQWRYARIDDIYDIGNKFYVWIYVNDYGSGNNIDIDDFQFNTNMSDVYFNAWDTPVLNGVYNQKSLEIENIYPNQSKNIYLKTSLPSQDLSYVGNYNTNLKAWWEVPTNI